MLKKQCTLPLIAAGGIGNGESMAAALCLGAEGVQVGSRFAATHESSAHIAFKNEIINAGDGSTELTLKELTPVRLLKNKFYKEVQTAYANNANIEQLHELLGRGRAKKGMFEGNLEDGELEIGQVSAYIQEIVSAKEVVDELISGCKLALERMNEQFKF
jgi:enoyl-[acyl-carrier protein] reductase II